jgi:hypothetical protein
MIGGMKLSADVRAAMTVQAQVSLQNERMAVLLVWN